MHTHSTGKGCISRQGTPLRTGHPRLRPAVTHCYSEMVTSGASLPFILEWTRACRGPFLSGVATTEEVSQRTAGGSARAKGPGRRKSEKKTQKRNYNTGNSSAVRPQDGRDGARAPPRGQMWHPNCNHLVHSGAPADQHLQSKKMKMLTPEREGTSGPGAGILFCQGHISRYRERCPVWTQSSEATGSRILTGAFTWRDLAPASISIHISQMKARTPLNL